jgi:hypothetical protein
LLYSVITEPPLTNVNKEAPVLVWTFIRLTTTVVVVAVALMLASPFFLALSWPFFGE